MAIMVEARLRWRREGLRFLGWLIEGGVESFSDSGIDFFR